MVNALTSKVGVTLGPIVLETLVKHYFERLRRGGKGTTQLRQDELLYDQAFNVVKNFLAEASFHTVEECQSFANTRTPSPPWVRVVRVVVPISCCDEAALHLIQVLGGEEVVKHTVGGTKWWQVRGLDGIDAQWVVAKKDWKEAKKKYEEQDKQNDKSPESSTRDSPNVSEDNDPESGDYQKEMDEMRCILYCHGGGYYFGSVDQERYCIQRMARKMNGRVFAVNYRLAPQYPFPCAIQDVVAAYLFLIQPPEGALHRAVNPAHIILAGDSAGGGITIALLQVIRDAGLPMPAGAVLISPWCDLSHSFPSIHTNTDTDVIPEYGLSMQKPSTLWPPPSEEMTTQVHSSLRTRIQQMVHITSDAPSRPKTSLNMHRKTGSDALGLGHGNGMPVDVGATAAAPALGSKDKQTITLQAQSGEILRVDQQVHLYTQNSLIVHPLVSPALSYLGGLPPLLIIAGNSEVLRDEIIYTAHRAANPEKYPIKESTRQIYPSLQGIEARFKPTPVHLQVYDDAAHVLPVLFAFTTPAKFCFRAMATFCKQVTGMAPLPPLSPVLSKVTSGPFTASPLPSSAIPPLPQSPVLSTPTSQPFTASPQPSAINLNLPPQPSMTRSNTDVTAAATRKAANASTTSLGARSSKSRTRSLRRGFSTLVGRSRATSTGESVPSVPPLPSNSNGSEDVAGPRFRKKSLLQPGAREAGDAVVYSNSMEFPSWNKGMIRERVSTRGVIRPLEPESDLDAFQVPEEIIGNFSELAVRRYLDAQAKFDKKFHGTQKVIDKRRQRNLELAKNDIFRNMATLQGDVSNSKGKKLPKRKETVQKGIMAGLQAASGSWSWAWALDAGERPPPSSIVSRRDTTEARRLARVADQAGLDDDNTWMSGNQLWSSLTDFLTAPPGKDTPKSTPKVDTEELKDDAMSGSGNPPAASVGKKRSASMFALFTRAKEPMNGQGVEPVNA
ncbi:alpha/beta-hydrolase [Athelia psychrophila]|uniref:Alpha/beta-hydrolase n=1 Tax=Athelia psychrophila TaxID=1759441 RepID=A0A166RQ10_9AGAM|nr:alpha/beta-hydrolase [Fibularhizoctonia sp. CBS 109695]